MNKAIARAKQLLDNIHLIPGYSPDYGEIVISISQCHGTARHVDVTWRTIERAELMGGSMQRVVERKVRL